MTGLQVVSVHYGPHEESVLHDHPGGVVVSLNEAHLRFTDENGKTREVFSKAGEVRWYPPFKHRVENLGDTIYDGVYVGVKGKLARTSNGSTNPSTATEEETKKLSRNIFWLRVSGERVESEAATGRLAARLKPRLFKAAQKRSLSVFR